MKRILLAPALFVVLSACGSDSDDASSTSAATAATDAPETTEQPAETTDAPDETTGQPGLSAGCDDALSEAEAAVADVMDIFDAAETPADLEAIDPDDIGAAFELLGEAVGTGCSADELDGAVSRLITSTADGADGRSAGAAGFASGFIPELCVLSQSLTPEAAAVCDTAANS